MDSTNKPSPPPTTGRTFVTVDSLQQLIDESEKERHQRKAKEAGSTRGVGVIKEHTDPATGIVSADFSGLETRVLSAGRAAQQAIKNLSELTWKVEKGMVVGIGCGTPPDVKLYTQDDLDAAVVAAVGVERQRLSAKLARDAEAQTHAHGFSLGAKAVARELSSLSNRIARNSY